MSCNSCNERSKIKFTWSIILSIEILITSVYGHIHLINKLMTFFRNFF